MPRGDLGEARVSIIGDSSQLRRTLSSTRGMVASWGDSIKSIIAGALTFTGVVVGIRSIVKEVDEELKAIARLNAVLTSTHMAAGLTVDQLQRMASSLQAVTTYGDETIMSAQALLLTFTRIGGEVFPRALKAVLDISAALGQDLKSSAIQVGKALQDPAWGITALRRVGVNFTRVQQDMIKNWIQQGEILKSQQFILAELEREFGGMSEAMRGTLGGAFQALRNDIGDLIQALVGMGSAGEAIYDISVSLSAGFQELTRAISDSHQAASDFHESLSGLSQVLIGLISIVGGFYVGLTTIYEILKALVKTAIDLTELLTRLFAVFWETVIERKFNFAEPFRAFNELKKGLADIAENFVTMHKNIGDAYDQVARFGATSLETFSKVTKEINVSRASMGEVRRELAQLDEGLVQTGKTASKAVKDTIDETKEALERHWEYVKSGWGGLVSIISSSIANVIRDTKIKFKDLINSIIQNLAYAIVEAAIFAAIMTAILSALGIPIGPAPFRTMFLGRLGFPPTGWGRQPLQRAGGQPVIELRPTYQLMIDSRIVAGVVMVETARRRRYGL